MKKKHEIENTQLKIVKETMNVILKDSNSEWEKHLIDENRIYFLEREKKVKNN